MRIVYSDELRPGDAIHLSTELRYWCYNALDTCVTFEVFNEISKQLDSTTSKTYEFAKTLQAPVLEMKLRGVLVDQQRRAEVITDFERKLSYVEHNLHSLVCDGVGFRLRPSDPSRPRTEKGEFNWRSPDQIKKLFYEVMRLPPQKSKGKITVEREALEKLSGYFHASPIIQHLLVLRDLGKKIGVLRTGIDDDGRMRTSYNIAGTETGRFSSNVSDFGTGTNLQNIEDSLRTMFVADPGYKFAYIDLEQAESRAVGAICWNLFHRGEYLDACESGDLHTTVTRLARPNLHWTGDAKADRDVADSPGYRHLSLRDLSKKLGHGTNYFGKPPTMARHSKLPVAVIQEFQGAYFKAFPEIPLWHEHVRRSLLDEGHITSLSGRRRHFFGRRSDDSTLREAIAFDPQGSVGDILNLGMREVWRLNKVHLLMQIHDAILVQYPAHLEAQLLPLIQSAIEIPIPLAHGRTMTIPSETQVGWNFGKYKEGTNEDGLRKIKGTDTRRRQRIPPPRQAPSLLAGLLV